MATTMTQGSAAIESMQHEERVFAPPAWGASAHVTSRAHYAALYDESLHSPDAFWGRVARDFVWFTPWHTLREWSFQSPVSIKYFLGATTNVTVNALDRHVDAGLGARAAYHWEGNDGETRTMTYAELLDLTCRVANALKARGVRKGDRVTVYMPMVPELAAAVLACARIGAVHSVIFGGFSPESIKDRLLDAQSSVIITADAVLRGNKTIALKDTIDAACTLAASDGHPVTTCIVLRRLGTDVAMTSGRDLWWHDVVPQAANVCVPEPMDAEDPLFILYTSGSTGKPKGVLHTTGGYMVYAATTFKYVFDYRETDVYWCTADIGWVTGHSYVVYGPLCNAATSVMFEGIPNFPQPDRFWAICAKYNVSIFYTAPTAIRALMREGTDWPAGHDLSALRVLGTVGEPINPEAWMWYHTHVGGSRCPIVDTWWQTETGGILISALPGAVSLKPGSATLPFFGVAPEVIRENGVSCAPNEGGYLVLNEPWPGMMRTVYGAHERFEETYFSRFPGRYFTGDGARCDADGYYWLMGRVDDVINVSGHRIGTAEVESALVAHPAVAEAAVVGFPHTIKGEALYAYVTLKAGQAATDLMRQELKQHVRTLIGAIAVPDVLHWADALPKTRSGKIMRRILRKIAAGETGELGDTSTLADPSVVDALVAGRTTVALSIASRAQ